MSWIAEHPVEAASSVGLLLLCASLLMMGFRLARGPHPVDRVLALDMYGTLLVAMFTVQAIRTNQPELVRLAAVLALVSFVGTVALASYIRGKVQ